MSPNVNKLIYDLKSPAIFFIVEMTPFGTVKPYILHFSPSWLEFSVAELERSECKELRLFSKLTLNLLWYRYSRTGKYRR